MARRFYFTDGTSIEINEDDIHGVYLIEFFDKQGKLSFTKEINHFDLLGLTATITEFK